MSKEKSAKISINFQFWNTNPTVIYEKYPKNGWVFVLKYSWYSERPAHSDEEWLPLATTRESPRTETKTQHSHKLKINK